MALASALSQWYSDKRKLNNENGQRRSENIETVALLAALASMASGTTPRLIGVVI